MPRPAAPGLSAAYDYEYERNGVSSLFMLFERDSLLSDGAESRSESVAPRWTVAHVIKNFWSTRTTLDRVTGSCW